MTNEQDEEDPIEAMWGLGREIWLDVDADSYVGSLRAGWDAALPVNRTES